MHLGSLKSGWRDRPKRNGIPRDQASNCGISLVVQRLWLTLCAHCGGPGFNPWLGNWILHPATKTQHRKKEIFKNFNQLQWLLPFNIYIYIMGFRIYIYIIQFQLHTNLKLKQRVCFKSNKSMRLYKENGFLWQKILNARLNHFRFVHSDYQDPVSSWMVLWKVALVLFQQLWENWIQNVSN